MTLICPSCKEKINTEPTAYVCPACHWKINKVHAGLSITPDIVMELAANGRTGLLDNFYSKAGKPFRASLGTTTRGVEFIFASQKQPQPVRETAKEPGLTHNSTQSGQKSSTIRVESPSPGVVQLNIYGDRKFDSLINFGLHPSRISEALGAIVGARYLQYHGQTKHLIISANEKTFVEYALREKNPRAKEAQVAIEAFWNAMKPFDNWEIKLAHKKNMKLKGGQSSSAFPRGIFPGLKAKTEVNGSTLYVTLPDRLEIQAQFLASFGNAHQKGLTFGLPAPAERAVNAWLTSVNS